MKVGDLVKNRRGDPGVVLALGHSGEFSCFADCPWINPDVHVMTPDGKRLWSYKVLKVISESR